MLEIINQELNKLKLFKELNQISKKKINESSKILTYDVGQIIISSQSIPDKVFVIIEGEARLIGENNNKPNTIVKFERGSILGIGSILRVSAFEQINASTVVKAIAISDEVIIDIYKNDKFFHDWCNETVQPSEIWKLTEKLIKDSSRVDLDYKKCFIEVLKYTKIINISAELNLKIKKDYKYFIGSQNIKNQKLLSLINKDSIIQCNPPLKGRVLKLPDNLYQQFFQSTIKSNDKLLKNKINTNNKAPKSPDRSSLDLGQYRPENKMKFIRASGALQETLAILQMISAKNDLPFRKDTVEKILRDEINQGKKLSMQLCGQLLSLLGLQVMSGKVGPESGSRLPSNSLIIWKDKLSIILESNSKYLSLFTPEHGTVDIKKDNINEEFPDGFEMLIVERTNTSPTKKFGIQWFAPSLKKYRSVLTQVLIASFVVQLFGLANPLLIQVIIDKVISQRSLDTLQVLGIALVFVTILGGVIGSLRTFLFAETTNRIDIRLGSEVIDHLLRLPLKYFDKRPVGELGSRVGELEKIRNFLTGQALTTILDAAFSIIYIIVMVIYSWLLTLIALAVVPIQVGITLLGSPLIRSQIRQAAKENAKTQSHLVEVLTGVQTVKAQNVETVSRWKWQDLYNKYIARTFEKTITTTALSQTSTVLQQLSQLFVLWIGASLVLAGEMTLGQLIAFRIISGYVTQPLLRLSSIWQSIQELKVSIERLADIVDTQEESSASDKANIPLPLIKGKVSFKEVSFAFNLTSQKILKNINLNIDQGTFVGIAGQSGSGKSTLMKLLPRLYEIKEGRIFIDNYDISKVELYSLRRQIGIVPQDPLLFSGTVSENIALTNPDATGDEIIKAAKIADAHNFIMDLPQGYSSTVGERGAGLSGGQKQRIAIARTLLSNPRLLILDEATSALDYETERRVCENLREECKNCTVFFITHRLSTIKNANLVILMHEGSINEIGTHEELMNNKGRYYALYLQQDSN